MSHNAPHKVVQIRRGSTDDNDSLTGAEGELTVDLEKRTLVVHNGIQQGGYPLRRADAMFNRNFSISFRAGVVQQGIPALGFSTLENAPTAIAIDTPSGVATVAASFDYDEFQQVQGNFTIPSNWNNTAISSTITWRCGFSTLPVPAVNWVLEVGGLADGETIESFSFLPPEHAIAQSTGVNEIMNSTIELTSLTGILPSCELYFRLGRGSDVLIYPVELLSIRFNVDRYDL